MKETVALTAGGHTVGKALTVMAENLAQIQKPRICMNKVLAGTTINLVALAVIR